MNNKDIYHLLPIFLNTFSGANQSPKLCSFEVILIRSYSLKDVLLAYLGEIYFYKNMIKPLENYHRSMAFLVKLMWKWNNSLFINIKSFNLFLKNVIGNHRNQLEYKQNLGSMDEGEKTMSLSWSTIPNTTIDLFPTKLLFCEIVCFPIWVCLIVCFNIAIWVLLVSLSFWLMLLQTLK